MNNQFGEKLRNLREENNLLLRQLASKLDMDTAQLSKIERGERQAKKETVIDLAKIFNVKEDELLTLWLAEKVYKIVQDEQFGHNALIVAEERIEYSKNKQYDCK